MTQEILKKIEIIAKHEAHRQHGLKWEYKEKYNEAFLVCLEAYKKAKDKKNIFSYMTTAVKRNFARQCEKQGFKGKEQEIELLWYRNNSVREQNCLIAKEYIKDRMEFLTEYEKTVFCLHYENGLKIGEIALKMGKKQQNISKSWQKAVKRIINNN